MSFFSLFLFFFVFFFPKWGGCRAKALKPFSVVFLAVEMPLQPLSVPSAPLPPASIRRAFNAFTSHSFSLSKCTVKS